jgi:hypothetical protein
MGRNEKSQRRGAERAQEKQRSLILVFLYSAMHFFKSSLMRRSFSFSSAPLCVPCASALKPFSLRRYG